MGGILTGRNCGRGFALTPGIGVKILAAGMAFGSGAFGSDASGSGASGSGSASSSALVALALLVEGWGGALPNPLGVPFGKL